MADLGGGQGGQSPPRFSQVMNINFYCIYTLTTDDSLAMFSKYLHSCQPAYSTLYYLTQIALTIAVTSVEAERTVLLCSQAHKDSPQEYNGTKPFIKSGGLFSLSIEREIAQKIDHDDVIDEFASSDKNRRIVLY